MVPGVPSVNLSGREPLVVDEKRGSQVSVLTTSGNGGLVTDERVIGKTGSDIVSVRNDREVLAGMLCSAVGFRVDCPEGRVGVLTRVIPDHDGLLPARIEVATGLFI